MICQAAQNALAGAQHTELVVIGIGHDHPVDLALADVDSSRPKRNETVYLRSLINVAGRSDVEMEPVLPDLRGKRRATPGDERTRAVRRTPYSGGVIRGSAVSPPPEPGVRIELTTSSLQVKCSAD